MRLLDLDLRSSLGLSAGLLGWLATTACAEPGRDSGAPLPGGVFDSVGAADSGSEGDPGSESDDEPDPQASEDDEVLFDLGASTAGDDGPADTCQQDVDIVFVMDVTSSMGEFIETLADDLHTVDTAVRALDLPTEPRYGLVVFADDYALLNDGAPYPDLPSLEAEFADWIDFTQGDDQIGGGDPNYSYPENSLDALVATTGFEWRPADSTTRIVIHTTDDTFWDGPGEFNGEPVEHDYASAIEALQAQSIRVFSFAAHQGGDCECEDVASGWFTPYEGQPSIPESTDGGVFDIVEVLEGALSLGAAIPESVAESVCDPYDPVG